MSQRIFPLWVVLTVCTGLFATENYQLDVTALQDSTGKTDIYLKVAGDVANLETAQHIQLKSLDSNGQLVWTQNVRSVAMNTNGVQSVTTMSYTDMERYQVVDAQVQVHPDQTYVIRAENTVYLRPDISVEGVSLDGQAIVGEVINIPVHIAELNHDLGATISVALKNGAEELDRVSSVSLDAGESGDAVFSVVFNAPGIYSLTVDVADVNPGDFNYENNSYTFDLEVIDGVRAADYSISYRNSILENYREWSNAYSTGVEYNLTENQYFSQRIAMNDLAASFPVDRVSLQVEADGVLAYDMELTNISATIEFGGPCSHYASTSVNLGNGMYLYITSNEFTCYGNSNIYTYAIFNQYASKNVWFSESHSTYWGYSFDSGSNTNGQFIDAKDLITTRFVLECSAGSYGGDVTLPISTNVYYDYEFDYSYGDSYNRGFNRSYANEGYGSGETQPQ